jgi:hypothetical protein
MAALQRMKPEGLSHWRGFKPEGLVYPLPGAKPPESVFTESKGLEGRHTNPNRTLQSWFALGLERRVFEHEHEHEHELKLKLKFEYWIGRGEGVGSVLVPNPRELRFARKQQNLKNPGEFE